MQVRKANAKQNRRGESWEETRTRIHREHPSTVDAQGPFAGPLGASDTERAAATAAGSRISEAGLFRLIGDLGNVGNTPTRRGHRPPPSDGDVAQTIQTVFRDGLGVGRGPHIEREYTTRPFVEAVAIMIGHRSSLQMSRRTGIQVDRMKRIRKGTYPPTGDEMAAIARTFGKAPWYFREVRSAMVAAIVLAQMDADPDQSARIVKALRP